MGARISRAPSVIPVLATGMAGICEQITAIAPTQKSIRMGDYTATSTIGSPIVGGWAGLGPAMTEMAVDYLRKPPSWRVCAMRR